MDYILGKSLKVTRPVIFLCGPTYFKNNASDRRNILRENLNRVYKKKGQDVLPLIVDLFLTEENINSDLYSVQLMEEICAAISCQTHIFLDSMSAATELGIFANSAYLNEVCVYIPKNSDVYNKGNVGEFVRKAVLNNPNKEIISLEYRPKLEKKAFSSLYIAEHYGFINNRIPQNILELLERKAITNSLSNEKNIIYEKSIDLPKEDYILTYMFDEDKLSVAISIKLLFYIVDSILEQEFDDLKKGVVPNLDINAENVLIQDIKRAIITSVSFELGVDRTQYMHTEIRTIIKSSTDDVIKHMIKFIMVYYGKSQFNKMALINSSAYVAIKHNVGKHPNTLFDLKKDDVNLIEQINDNPDNYFEKFSFISGNKRRELIKYSNNIYGESAKRLHKLLDTLFRKKYKHNECSYAYHKGCSIVKCVNVHKMSQGFVKMDISSFFNSISIDTLLEKLMSDLQIDVHYEDYFKSILQCCFVDGKLPLGLVTSPILSDYYLYAFDATMVKFCKEKQLLYTRYADDILISSENFIDASCYSQIIGKVKEELNDLGLKLNQNKCLSVNFDDSQSYIRYIGVNIVKGENGNSNYLSVGKKYIYTLAKEYMEYDKICSSIEEIEDEDEKKKLEENVFYKRTEIIGKIGFIKTVEGERGIERLQVRLKKYYPDIDVEAI